MNSTGYSVTFLTFNIFPTIVRPLYPNSLRHLEKNQCLTLKISFHCHLSIHRPYRHQLLTKCLLAKSCQKTIESLVLLMVKLPGHFPLGQADKTIEHVSSFTQGFGSLLLIYAVGELDRMVAFVTDQHHWNQKGCFFCP